jgi:hypothetical protein
MLAFEEGEIGYARDRAGRRSRKEKSWGWMVGGDEKGVAFTFDQ